jgi:hypothetical protein
MLSELVEPATSRGGWPVLSFGCYPSMTVNRSQFRRGARLLFERTSTKAIAAPAVNYRNCPASFPFPVATESGIFTQRGPTLRCGIEKVSASQTIAMPDYLWPRSARLISLHPRSHFHAQWPAEDSCHFAQDDRLAMCHCVWLRDTSLQSQ